MHVITRKRLNEFAETHPATRSSLARWYVIMRKSRFMKAIHSRSLMDVLGVLIEKYEDEKVPELTE